MNYQKGTKVYEGKAKIIYAVEAHPELVWMEFKDSLTAFNALKKGSFENKGQINTKISQKIFEYLESNNVPTHFVRRVNEHELICRKVEIIPLEVVVRNKVAGSLAKRFGLVEGKDLATSLVEFYLKDDALGDPLITDDQAVVLGFIDSHQTLQHLKHQTGKINVLLTKFFHKIDLELIDFKIEFGRDENGVIWLADEITPDSCRLWDLNSGEKMDKDRFRHDLGNVKESYVEVLNRINKNWGE